LDHPGRGCEDRATGVERGKVEHCGSGLEEEVEYHGHIPEIEDCTGAKKFVGRGKYCTRGEAGKAGSVGTISARG
jgi:hypothetical protein